MIVPSPGGQRSIRVGGVGMAAKPFNAGQDHGYATTFCTIRALESSPVYMLNRLATIALAGFLLPAWCQESRHLYAIFRDRKLVADDRILNFDRVQLLDKLSQIPA
jgi:hypothetical protein